MKVAIIGAGAMGCLFAAKLAQAGNHILLVEHDPETISAIRKNGVQIKDGQTRKKVKVPIRESPGDLKGFELILVMVKAYSTQFVVSQLRGRIGESSAILTLQNGLGNVEVLCQAFGHRVLAGSTTEASLRLGPGEVEHTGRGSTLVGEMNGGSSRRAANVVRLLKDAGFPSLNTRYARSVVWSKAVLNSAINPVSALTRQRNGPLGRAKALRGLMLAILDEGAKIGEAEGVTLNVTYLSRLLSKVLRSTGQNLSSMLQDVVNGRKTEVREINGMISRLGRKNGIATPLNDILLSLMLGLEDSYA